MNRVATLIRNWQAVQHTIEKACQHSGRNPAEVELMAVTKYASDEDVLKLLETGRIQHIGESRVQQAISRWKRPEFAKYSVYKHFIGHLQKNKAAQAAALFDFIDSIDKLETAVLLDKCAEQLHKNLHVLVQIKLTSRPTQSGIALAEAPALVAAMKQLPHLTLCGYMAIAPQTDDTALLRTLFQQVRLAFERDFSKGQKRYLSLGMSNDFELAVEQGSTLPRVGSLLFAQHLEE